MLVISLFLKTCFQESMLLRWPGKVFTSLLYQNMAEILDPENILLITDSYKVTFNTLLILRLLSSGFQWMATESTV